MVKRRLQFCNEFQMIIYIYMIYQRGFDYVFKECRGYLRMKLINLANPSNTPSPVLALHIWTIKSYSIDL